MVSSGDAVLCCVWLAVLAWPLVGSLAGWRECDDDARPTSPRAQV